jgi:peptide/nickel transport system ATP-binding protein
MNLVARRTDRIAVFMNGELIEQGPTAGVIVNPQNEYTKKLIGAANRLTLSEYQTSDASISEPILRASDISKSFGEKKAVSDASIFVGKGECVGIVGESGSGKTTLARIIVGLTKADRGDIYYKGKGYPGIVFQDPYSSLNPAHSIRYILEEALAVAKRPKSDINELLALSELGEEILDRKPARLSGGQRQRVAIARALALEPELLVCDESVSALDILVQEQILQTLDKLRKTRRLAVLFITHDLSVVKMIASRVYVMSESKIIENGTVKEIFTNPKSEFTKNLLAVAEGVEKKRF